MFIPPYRVSLSGGGIKGFAHIGVLQVLEERGYLKHVREYIGISAGALCAFCICIGCSLTEIRSIVSRLDFGSIRDFDIETIMDFPETFGLDTGVKLDKLLAALLRGKGIDPDITFQELASKAVGPALRVFATNMNTCLVQEFGLKCSPDVGVRFAVHASMSIPIYFKPVKEPRSGHLFLDGGISHPSPFKYLTRDEQVHTLAVVFGYKDKPTDNIQDLGRFLYQLYYSIYFKESVDTIENWSINMIQVDCGGINSINFEADAEIKNEIIAAGRRAAESFLVSPGKRKRPVRRFSTPS